MLYLFELLFVICGSTLVVALTDCATFTESIDGEDIVCSGHGTCTSATKHCSCYEGFGSLSELQKKLQPPFPAPDCSERVCPFGKSWSDIPSSATEAHAAAECSDRGTCDRSTGFCVCFPGFDGAACARRSCKLETGIEGDIILDCSGHGRCMTLAELAQQIDAQPLNSATAYGGYSSTVTWDEDMITACLCDSSWEVGLASGQRQLPEYFGLYCERRRCPSGSDPLVDSDETDCEGKIQDPISGAIDDDIINGGATGNLCHVDCSNRGICDYETGVCRCFTGYSGENCAIQDALSKW